MRVLIAGGGTGGHVIPALAIARQLRDAHDADVCFVGTARGLEVKLVPEAGLALELIRVGQLKNVSVATRVRTLADLPLGVRQCVRMLQEFRPQVALGVGGYASGPAMVAAVLLRIPTMAFEPNAVPGLANRLVGRYVRAAAVNFEETLRYFPGARGRGRVTGVPVRAEFFAIPEKLVGGLRLLVFGGSLGARVLNTTVPHIVHELLQRVPGLSLVHQAGARNLEVTTVAYREAGIELGPEGRVQVVPYLEDMVAAFAEADLILCRSGASTVAELAAAGRAAVLVPFPLAADDHQRRNAEAFVARGAGRMLLEGEMTEKRLADLLVGLLGDAEERRRIEDAARGLAKPRALEEIGEMVRELARSAMDR